MKISNLIEKMTGNSISTALKFHRDTSIAVLTNNLNTNNWPEEWKKIHFKLYPRFKTIQLIYPKSFEGSLSEAIRNRSSKRNLRNYKISKYEISNILYFGAGIITNGITDLDSTKRAYPSAGARYPLEVYLIVLNSQEIEHGLYHYNVKSHCLELLLNEQLKNKISKITDQDWVKNSSVILVITAVIGRSQIKYGDRAYRHSLLETGHLGQNIYLITNSLGLSCCAIGGFVDKEVNKLLDVNEEEEFAIYLLAVGK